ncbi:MAG TPA: hypothetical protein VG458_05480, partial [Solirubrobacterales bacterium]|nr:hypothetical protein [Solirubrobacterales bacterium]
VDPAEMMAEGEGAERFGELIERAEELSSFQVGLVLARTDVSSPVERDRALEEVAPVLAGLGEGALRDDLVRRVAERLDFDPGTVLARVTVAEPTTGGSGGAGQVYESFSAEAQATSAQPPRRAAELTSRERRERALLAMCIALPAEGREYLARLTDAHLSPTGLRAAAWLRENPGDPASNLPHDDEMASLISELVMISHDQPASREAMELNFLLLEQRRLEDEIAAAGERGDYEHRAALSRERAALVEKIAHTQRVES